MLQVDFWHMLLSSTLTDTWTVSGFSAKVSSWVLWDNNVVPPAWKPAISRSSSYQWDLTTSLATAVASNWQQWWQPSRNLVPGSSSGEWWNLDLLTHALVSPTCLQQVQADSWSNIKRSAQSIFPRTLGHHIPVGFSTSWIAQRCFKELLC